MKSIILALSCLLCIVAAGGVLHARKIQSIASQNDADHSISEEQTEVSVDIALSDIVPLDNLRAINPNLSIAEQQQVISLVANASLDEIIEAVANMPSDNNQPQDYQWIIGPIIQRWIELDPDGALLEVTEVVSPQHTMRDNLASDLLIENYAGMHPESLIEQMGSIPINASRPDKLMVMYWALAESAPDLAMQLLTQNNSLSSEEFSPPVLVFRAWSEQDPQAALQWLEQNGDKQLLDEHAESLISKLASRDPDAARTAAARFPRRVSEDEFVIQEIRILTESDPVAAMKMTKSLPEGNMRDDTIQSILSAWSTRDLFAAFEYVESIADSSKKPMYVSSMSRSIASRSTQSPVKRLELLNWSESLSTESQMGVREVIVSEWARTDPEAAIEWLSTHGGLSNYYMLVHAIAWSLPERNMDMALDFYSSVYSSLNRESQMKLSRGIACELYENDPQTAWRWYEGLPKDHTKQSVLFELVMTTAREYPVEALDIVYSANSGNNVEMTIRVIEIIAYDFDYPAEVENWLAAANIDEQHAIKIKAAMAKMQLDTNNEPILLNTSGC